MSMSTDEVRRGVDTAAPRQAADDVEAYLDAFLRRRPLPKNLEAAIRYALLGGGKRLRPILTLRACQAVGGSADAALAPAGAIEMIHCFSLVHDDLPAMDDDDLRRGRPTLHRHAGEAMAVLAGDAMLGLAFELVATELQPAERARAVTAELATAANDMIAGQVHDTLPDFDPGTDAAARLLTIHRLKTAALIRCACRMGALCGDAGPRQLDAVSRYGDAIGLMFQVVDDLLDVTGSAEHLGKAAQKDADQGKTTCPGVWGLDRSRREIRRLHDEAIAALDMFDADAEPLREMCRFMAVRTR